ncbi:hypothetical protein ACN47E_005193 [Coniothyrium glycines]
MTKLYLIHVILHISVVFAQNPSLGTITQDISTFAVYSQQKNCAISCFKTGGVLCPFDALGHAIGCAQSGLCDSKGWQARNDCYCSPGLIQTAQEYLEACVSASCSVGDVSVDVSSATSIYSRYCAEKGYVAAAPANVPATTTATNNSPSATSGFRTTSRTPAATATGTSTGSDSSSTDSGSNSLSTSSIIGIVVGGVAALCILVVGLRKLFTGSFGSKPNHQQQPPQFQQAPVYPKMSQQEPWYPSPGPASEVEPNDSVSMVGGIARPAPTLVSDMRYPGRW